MKLTYGSILKIILLTSVVYYCGFLGFSLRLFEPSAGSHGVELMESNASGTFLKQLIGLGLFACSALLIYRTGRQRLAFIIKSNIAWMLLIGYLILSVSWSLEPGISARRIVGLVTVVLTALALCLYFHPKSLLIFIANAIFLAACIGLVVLVVKPSMATADVMERGLSFVGMFGDKNAGARSYVYAVLIFVALNEKVTKTFLLKVGILVCCIIFAKSASAAILLLAGLGIIFILKNMQSLRRAENFKNSTLFCLMIISVAILLNWLYPYVLEFFGRDPNLSNRTIIWELLSIEIAEKPVIGYGFGAFWASTAVEAFVDRWGFIGNAHSGYYEMLLNGGFLGLVLEGILMAAVLFKGFSLYNRGNRIGVIIVTISLLQYIANYVGYIFLNYNNFDMFLFCILAFSPIGFKLFDDKSIISHSQFRRNIADSA